MVPPFGAILHRAEDHWSLEFALAGAEVAQLLLEFVLQDVVDFLGVAELQSFHRVAEGQHLLHPLFPHNLVELLAASGDCAVDGVGQLDLPRRQRFNLSLKLTDLAQHLLELLSVGCDLLLAAGLLEEGSSADLILFRFQGRLPVEFAQLSQLFLGQCLRGGCQVVELAVVLAGHALIWSEK